MVKQIVVGIDGSEKSFAALEQAIDVAVKTSCCIKCVFVIDSRKTQLPFMYSNEGFEGAFERLYVTPDPSMRRLYEQIGEDTRAFAERCMRECHERIHARQLEPITVIKEGYPSIELAEEARSGGLLVVGRRGENAEYKRSILGSTAEDLLRTSPRPVLIATKTPRIIRRVLFPYDDTRPAENSLQYYVNAMGNLAEEFVLLSVGQSGGLEHQLEEEMSYLARHGINAVHETREGKISTVILETAESLAADLILIGAQGKNTLKDYFIGSTVSHIVHNTAVPVLVVY